MERKFTFRSPEVYVPATEWIAFEILKIYTKEHILFHDSRQILRLGFKIHLGGLLLHN